LANSRLLTAAADHQRFLNSFLIERAAGIQAREFSYTIHEQTSDRGLEYQRVFLRRLLEQPVLKDVLPEFVQNHKELELCKVVCT
jgi:hypothetical protein